jgi:hypothetical protein
MRLDSGLIRDYLRRGRIHPVGIKRDRQDQEGILCRTAACAPGGGGGCFQVPASRLDRISSSGFNWCIAMRSELQPSRYEPFTEEELADLEEGEESECSLARECQEAQEGGHKP